MKKPHTAAFLHGGSQVSVRFDNRKFYGNGNRINHVSWTANTERFTPEVLSVAGQILQTCFLLILATQPSDQE